VQVITRRCPPRAAGRCVVVALPARILSRAPASSSTNTARRLISPPPATGDEAFLVMPSLRSSPCAQTVSRSHHDENCPQWPIAANASTERPSRPLGQLRRTSFVHHIHRWVFSGVRRSVLERALTSTTTSPTRRAAGALRPAAVVQVQYPKRASPRRREDVAASAGAPAGRPERLVHADRSKNSLQNQSAQPFLRPPAAPPR